MAVKYDELLKLFESEIRSALGYLEYSHRKIQNLPSDPVQLDEETLETWESYVARFARVTDLFEEVKVYTPFVISEMRKIFP